VVQDATAAAVAVVAAGAGKGRLVARWEEELQLAVGLQQLAEQDALLLLEVLQPPRWVPLHRGLHNPVSRWCTWAVGSQAGDCCCQMMIARSQMIFCPT
jgi:hypothetical protein